jgi:hypothetical protein
VRKDGGKIYISAKELQCKDLWILTIFWTWVFTTVLSRFAPSLTSGKWWGRGTAHQVRPSKQN